MAKATIEEMREKFMGLSQNRADEISQIYGPVGTASLDRGAQWRAIIEDAPGNSTYLQNALGLGHDAPTVEEEAPVEEEVAAAEPEAEEEEAEHVAVQAPARRGGGEPPEPVPSRFGRRTDEEIANVLYPRKGG